MRKISLDNGILTVDICPDCGGGVSALRLRGNTDCPDLLRPATEEALTSGNTSEMSCLPVTPFAGMPRNGTLTLQDHQIDLTACILTGGLPLQRWTVQDASHVRTTLTCYHPPGADGWPWAYQALQRFQLTRDSVSIYLAMTNVSIDPMPGGIGFSLNLDRRNGLLLTRTGASSADLQHSLELGTQAYYANLDGHETSLQLVWPEEQHTVVIQADPVFGHLGISQADANGSLRLCLSSNTANPTEFAGNSSETVLDMLQQADTLAGTLRIGITEGAAPESVS